MSHKSEDFDNLVQLLRYRAQAERAQEQGARQAYTFLVDGDEEGASYDYAALDLRARAIAGRLQQLIEPGARVLLLYPPGLDALTGFLGCLYAGAVAVPAPPPDAARLKRSLPRLRSIVGDSGASVLCCTGYIGELVDQLGDRVERFSHLQRVDTAAVPDELAASWSSPRIQPRDLAYLQYTSGSTSAAKGVMISHRNVMANLAYNRRLWHYAEDSVAVTWMPHFHDYGLVEGLLQPLYSAIPSYVMSPLAFLRRPVRWLEAISRYRATHSAAPNFGYDHCVQQASSAAGADLDLSSWRVASTGAEMVRQATLERFAERFSPCGFRREAFFPSFGLAEATLMCTTKVLPEQPPTLLHVDGRALRQGKVVELDSSTDTSATLVGCGTVDASTAGRDADTAARIAIVDPETGCRCRADEVGEIWVGGPFIGEGYWRRPEVSEEIFRARLTDEPEAGTFLRTGDLGFLHESRDLRVQDLYIVSRIKDMMIVRGYNHYPPDIEATVEDAHPLLRANCCAVFSVEAQDEERVVVVVEVERKFRDEKLPEVGGAIREAVLQAHELHVYALCLLRRGTLPKTSSGKVQRRAVKDAFLADSLDVVARLTQSETTDSSSLLAALLATGPTDDGASPAVDRLLTELLATPVGQRRQRFEAFVAAAVARLMELPAATLESGEQLSQLGLDSLTAARLRNRLERELGTTVPLPELLSGSAAQLTARLLERLQANEVVAGLDDLSDDAVGELLRHMLAGVPKAGRRRTDRATSGPLSFQQRRLWFLAQLAPRDPYYNLAIGVRLDGDPVPGAAGGGLDRGALERALGHLMRRHDALRTVFESRGGEPVQRVQSSLPRQVAHLDLSRLSPAHREATARRAARIAAQTPFDLTTGPLIRLLGIELTAGRTLLICVVHHIVFDGWSYDIFERELATAYRAFVAGREPDLAPLPVQLLDFSDFQSRQLPAEVLDDLLRYWKPQLLGLEALELPSDRPRLGASHRGASHFMIVPADLVAAAEAYGREQRATLFMVLLGAFQLLLARTTGEQDVAVGSPITNRDRDDFEQLIGLFANTLVLRTQVAPDGSFEDLVSGVRQMALDAYGHAQMPFEHLVQELSPERKEGANPLVQMGLALQPKVPLSTLSLPGLSTSPWPFEAALAKMDLEFHLLRSPAGLDGQVFYFADLFDATTIDRFSRHFERLLRAVLAEPGRATGSLSWFSAAETQQVVVEWNDTAAELAPHRLVHERILAQAASHPDTVAIEDGRQRLSWGELARRAEQLAAVLRRHGVGPETLVALWMERSLELIWGQLGVLCAGGAFLPLDPAHPEARLLDLIADAGPAVVLTRNRVAALSGLPRALAPVQVLRLGAAGVEDGEPLSAEPVSPRRPHLDNLAYVIYTSGSTGQPKGAELSHRGLLNLVDCHLFDYQVGERRTQIAAPGFDGTVFEIWPGLAAGTTVCLVAAAPREAPELLPAWLLEQRIDVCSVPTPIAEAALRDPWPQGLPLRVLHAAGDRLHRASVRDIGAELLNIYGPTETTSTATWCKVRSGDGDPPIGRPMMNVRGQVVDACLQPVPIGVAGELVLGGPVALARGYRRMPQRTAERFVPDPHGGVPGSRLYRTGDLVRLLASGEIEFLGRIDYQVKIRGNRIEIGEVMAALSQVPGLQEWAVVDRVRSRGDKELVAYLVAEPDTVCNPAELSAALHERLPGYMVPAAFVQLDALPRNVNGKLDRRALPAPARIDRAAAHEHVAPRTDAERRMAEVWSSVLAIEDVGVLDTFFELGGHSLLGSRLVAEVERCFDTQLALRDLFRAPTVSQLTALVAGQADLAGRDRLPPLQPAPDERFDRFPLTAVQQAYLLGRGESFDLGNVSAHGYLEFEGKGWRPARIEEVIRRLVARHDMLRAVFPGSDYQQVLAEVSDFKLPVQDLRGLAQAEVERAIEAWRDEMSHQVLPADRWPIFDVRVSLLEDDLVRLHLDGDGLIADAWSVGLLAREAIELYGDPEARLPEIEISFRDCVLAERKLYRSAAAERARDYWRQRLPDLPPAPELPLARSPESLSGQPRFEGRALRLDPDTWTRLRQQGAEIGLTPSGVLLAAFAETLGAWSKSRRLTLNLTTFNRRPWHEQVGLLVGDFTTLTLLAADGTGATFAERARGLQERLWSDLEHNQVDGLEVMRDLARRGHVSQAGLMPVVFSSILGQDPGGTDTFSSGWQERIVYRITQTPQVWLDHQVTEENGALLSNWDAVADLFPAGLLDAAFDAYHRLLLDLAAGSEAWAKWRPVELPAEQLAERSRSNQTAAEISTDLLHDGFGRQVAAQPEAPAVLTPELTLSYGDLDRLAWSLAHRLRRARVEPETLVAVVMEKGWQQAVAVLGILRAGAAYLPIDPALPAQRIEHLLEHGQVRVVVTQPWLQAQLEKLGTDAQLLAVGAEPAQADLEATPFDAGGRPESLAYVIFTSGSTGVPKGVMIDHRGAVNTLRDVNTRFRVGPQDRVLAISSLSFDLSVYDIFGVLDAGGAVVLPQASQSREPSHWLDLAERHRVTVWNSVPALMELCVDAAADAGRQLPPSLRLVLMSGDWIPVPLPAKLRALASPGIELISMGGATEASIWSILYPIGDVPETWTSIPYGRPMVNHTFHVLDADLEPRPVWVPGDLYIGGIGVALGYWRDAERTAERFLVHPRTGERLYRTGDLGRYLPSGEIEFLGREDFQVKVHGYRIELGEIEAALLAHSGVDKAVADARGERGARRLCAWWVPVADATPPDETTLRAFLAERLPEYMVPTALVQLSALPLSSNGKVDRQALPEPTRATSAAQGEASELAQRLGAVAAKVLEVETVDLDVDLFEVGVSSLHMIRIANLVEHELGLRLRIEDFYRAPTLAGLAALRGDAVAAKLSPSAAGGANRLQSDRWQSGRPLEPAEVERFKRDWRQRADATRADRGVVVALPPAPPTRLDAEFADARRSRRHFAAEPLAAETLSRWLACLAQRQRDGQAAHLYPSAGGIYPVEVYVHVRPGRVDGIEGGIYAYDASEHCLRRLSSADLDAGIHDPFVNRPIYLQAAFGLFLIAQARAIAPVYGAQARDFCVLEAGYMGQLLMLQAPECGIDVCPVGGLDFERVRQHFDLDAGHECVHSLLGGGLSDQPEPVAVFPEAPPEAPPQAPPEEPEPRLVPVPREGPLPLSFSQQRMWLAHRLEPDNPAYNTALLLRLRGRFDERAFERALHQVLARHEILRTCYVEVDGRPFQRIEPLAPWTLPRLDLSGLPPERGAELVEHLARAATRRPVDLTTAPLLHALSLRLDARDHALLLALHHIVGDAWSTGILAHELRGLYAAFAAGVAPPRLPELPLQYADFALWQQRWLASAAMTRELQYWRRCLAGVEPLALPTDHPRGQVASHAGTRRVLRLAPEQSARFEAVARRGAATRFAQYLGAVTVLLAWLCEQDDIVVGSPATHRDSLATEPLIGFFVNTLALRTDVSGDPTFEQLLGRVQETVRGAWEHRRVPFEKVLESVGRSTEARDAPLFRVWFVLHEQPPPGFELPGVETEAQEVATAAARYDLKLELWGQPAGGFRCDIEYRTELFEAATLERLERALLGLLAEVEPDAPLSTLRQRLSAAEQARRAEQGESFRGSRLQGLRQLRRPRRKVDPEAGS